MPMRSRPHDIGRRALLHGLASSGLAVASPQAAWAGMARLFAPRKSVDPTWTGHDESNTSRLDHTQFNDFLKRYAIRDRAGVVRVRYAEVTPSDRRQLRSYVQSLMAVAVSRLARAEQLAFWINSYNALTVGVVLDHYPVASIRNIDISGGLFARGPWDESLFMVEGHELTLNDIEHRILRPIWNDPRIHYAVNCASVSCPNLQLEAFTAASAPWQLDTGARDYVNDPRGARIVQGRLRVSSIYDWFQEDFGGSERFVLAHLAAYADGMLASRLSGFGDIAGYDYDWSLNDARGSP